MPSSRIPGERVALNDPKTGTISKPWYRFFNDLFELVGGGQDVMGTLEIETNFEMLQTAPPVAPAMGPILIGNVTASLNFVSTAANSSSVLTITVPGAVDGDMVRLSVTGTGVPAQGCYFAWVSAANTVSIRFINNTIAAVDPGLALFRVIVERY